MNDYNNSILYRKILGLVHNPLYIRLFTGVFWSLSGAVALKGLSFLASILTARILGSTKLGEYVVIQNTIGLFGVFASAGLGTAITKYVAEFRTISRKQTEDYIYVALLIAIIAGALVSLILFTLAPVITTSILKSVSLLSEVRIASFLVFLGSINGVQAGILIGLEKFKTVAKLAGIEGLTTAISLTLGSYYLGLQGAIIGSVVPQFVSLCTYQYFVRKENIRIGASSYNSINRGRLFELIKFSFPVLLGSIVVMPAFWISNVILINQPQGYSSLGIYNAADRWRQLILFIPSALSPIILPILSNLNGTNNTHDYKKIFRTNLFLNLTLVILPIILVISFPSQAMILFGKDFIAGKITLIILCLSVIGIVLNTVLGQVLVSKGFIWKRFFLDALLAAMIIGLSVWLVPLYKQNGLAIAFLVSYSITSIVLVIMATKDK